MKSLETLKNEYLAEALFHINKHEEYLKFSKANGNEITPDSRLMKFANLDNASKSATLNLMKLDQQINEAASNEVYNDITFIRKAWEDAYFEVDEQQSDHRLETCTALKRKSASKQFEEDYTLLANFKKQQSEDMLFYLGSTPAEEVKHRNPLAHKAYELLDEATVTKLEFNVKKIQKAIILKENNLFEVKLLKLLNQSFRVNDRYSNEYIKGKLQDLYTALNIRDHNGKIRTATANQLGERGRFDIKECKIPTIKGKPLNGYLILRQQFGLKMAA